MKRWHASRLAGVTSAISASLAVFLIFALPWHGPGPSEAGHSKTRSGAEPPARSRVFRWSGIHAFRVHLSGELSDAARTLPGLSLPDLAGSGAGAAEGSGTLAISLVRRSSGESVVFQFAFRSLTHPIASVNAASVTDVAGGHALGVVVDLDAKGNLSATKLDSRWPEALRETGLDVVELILSSRTSRPGSIVARRIESPCPPLVCALDTATEWPEFIGSRVVARNTLRLQLERRGDLSPHAMASTDAQRNNTETARWISAHRATLRASDAHGELRLARATLGNDDLDSLISRMDALDLEGEGNGDRARLERKFHALLRLRPELAGAFADLVAASERSTFRRLALLAALVEVGHRPAQDALVTLLEREDLEPSLRDTTLAVVHQLRAPMPALVEELQRLSASAASPRDRVHALLALGTTSARLPEHADALRGRVESATLARAEAAHDAGHTTPLRQTLVAMGNSGSLAYRDVVTAATRDARGEIRATGVFALRHQSGEDVTQTLLRHLDDPDVDVRVASLRALAYRRLGAAHVDAAIEAVKARPAYETRREVIDLVGAWAPTFPKEGRRILASLAGNEPSPRLAQRARGLLATL